MARWAARGLACSAAALILLSAGCTDSEPAAGASPGSPTEGSAWCRTTFPKASGDFLPRLTPERTEFVLTVADGQLAFAAALGADFATIPPGTSVSVGVTLWSDSDAFYSIDWEVRSDQELGDLPPRVTEVKPGAAGPDKNWTIKAYRLPNKNTGKDGAFLPVGGNVEFRSEAAAPAVISVGTQLDELTELGPDFSWSAQIMTLTAFAPLVGVAGLGLSESSCGGPDQQSQRFVSGEFITPDNNRQSAPSTQPSATSPTSSTLQGLRMMNRNEAMEQCRRLLGSEVRLPAPFDPSRPGFSDQNGTGSIGIAVNGQQDLVAFDPSSYNGPGGPGFGSVRWYLLTADNADPQPLSSNPAEPIGAQRSGETPSSAVRFTTDTQDRVVSCTIVETFEYPPGLFTVD